MINGGIFRDRARWLRCATTLDSGAHPKSESWIVARNWPASAGVAFKHRDDLENVLIAKNVLIAESAISNHLSLPELIPERPRVRGRSGDFDWFCRTASPRKKKLTLIAVQPGSRG
jgi:hypothetical protein